MLPIRRISNKKLGAALIGAVTLIGFATNYKSLKTVEIGPIWNNTAKVLDTVHLPFHPFDNACKFPLPNIYEEDVASWRLSERLRTLKCPPDHPLATQDSEGFLYIHPHFAQYPALIKDIHCEVVIIEGGYRIAGTDKGKNDYREVETIPVAENKRLWVNAGVFLVRCLHGPNQTVLWEKPFAGMPDEESKKNTVSEVPDLPSFDQYGRELIPPTVEKSLIDRLSIDILGFDSTSRTMFQRHLPRTTETMRRMGFHTLYGYNKVGDNSLVNLAPILIGDVKEAMEENRTDASGDVNHEGILPSARKIDPDGLEFLWKMMKKEFGCVSMLNEDISRKAYGLFNYPSKEFLPGFTRPPADHYYRAFYLAMYKNWTYSPCRDGGQIQREFVELWQRFASKYKDKCHFGFTFVTTLTHEAGFLLELLDEYLTSKLDHLLVTGALDNTVSIIMGDHGNRIGLVQYTYTGRIEERMPMMAIRLPPWFKEKYPVQYGNFQKNKWKLTSNFDVHQTLKDIALMEFGKGRREGERGISLFDQIPENRTCFEAHIPENFCSCLVDRKDVKKPLKNVVAKTETHRKVKSLQAIRNWLSSSSLSVCVSPSQLSLVSPSSLSTFGLNPLARHGLRNKDNANRTEQVRNAEPRLDYLHHELLITVPFSSPSHELSPAELLFRVDDNVSADRFRVVFEPSVRSAPSHCFFPSLFDVCRCMGYDVK